MRTWRPLVAGAALAGALALTAGCGVPIDKGPTTLSRNSVPFGLLDPSAPSTTTTTPAPSPPEVTVPIFLLNANGHLASVSRDVPSPATLSTILAALVAGPTASESTAGLQSAVPAQTVVLSATITGQTATVNLAGTFGQLVGQNEIDAVAQVVYTATSVTGVSAVTFELSGQAVDVPDSSGAEVPSAGQAQFASMAP